MHTPVYSRCIPWCKLDADSGVHPMHTPVYIRYIVRWPNCNKSKSEGLKCKKDQIGSQIGSKLGDGGGFNFWWTGWRTRQRVGLHRVGSPEVVERLRLLSLLYTGMSSVKLRPGRRSVKLQPDQAPVWR
ncbi:hypothetical protein DY000_02032059 [Brassica cretica]|uniref:Uncharacterized protein n=1 Tax=Brassica cretica TaxID=69181 RepID=A0ABQ7DZB3_BRACR|nr:hypothetical protein DY000_02032059 [Brassica cretica]